MAITVTIQPSNTDGEDCLIDSANPTINYNRQSTASISGTRVALIKFNLANYIPLKSKLIGMAKFEVYLSTGSDVYLPLTILKRDFVYNEATWNNWKAGSAWTTAGAKHTDDCFGGWAYNSIIAEGWLNSIGPETAWRGFWIPASIFDASLKQSTHGYGVLITTWWAAGERACGIYMCGNATPANRPKYTFSYEPYHKIYMVKSGLGQVK